MEVIQLKKSIILEYKQTLGNSGKLGRNPTGTASLFV